MFTFRWAGEETKRLSGEVFPLDFDPSSEGSIAFVKRVPAGPCVFITPFNFPLNLVAHKAAPAMAIGASFVLKPASAAVKTALKLREIAVGAGWPEDAFQVAVCRGKEAAVLVEDERFGVFSFTGSAEVGWMLKRRAGKKRVGLELGGNAAVAVGPDADLERAASRCVWGGFYYSGQVCISVQRIYVHRNVYEKFKKLFLKKAAALKVGRPADEKTDIGPLITESDAVRVESWIDEAARAGGKMLIGGPRKDAVIPPTIMEGVPTQCRLHAEEAFAPVVIMDKFSDWREAIKQINDSRFGLQAGIFTRDIRTAMEAWDGIRAGGIIINDVPTFRSDPMPYGGCKDSGAGREGIRYAMEEYTEPRTLILHK